VVRTDILWAASSNGLAFKFKLNNMKKTLVQLTNAAGEHIGLYTTDRTDTENFQGIFDQDIAAAKYTAETEEDVDLSEQMDDLLNEDGFDRVWAEEVTTNNPLL
jgi:hypothetical protein